MRTTLAAAILMAVFSSGAQAQVSGSAPDRAVLGAITEWKSRALLSLCFDRARLMIFGAHHNEKGIPLQAFVDRGVLPIDSDDYKLVADGYRMLGVMDNAARDYFLRCAEPVVSTGN